MRNPFRNLFKKKVVITCSMPCKNLGKTEARVCCYNCQQFTIADGEKQGFCSELFMDYNVMWIPKFCNCENFVLRRKFQDRYFIDWDTRDSELDIRHQLRNRKQWGVHNDQPVS